MKHRSISNSEQYFVNGKFLPSAKGIDKCLGIMIGIDTLSCFLIFLHEKEPFCPSFWSVVGQDRVDESISILL